MYEHLPDMESRTSRAIKRLKDVVGFRLDIPTDIEFGTLTSFRAHQRYVMQKSSLAIDSIALHYAREQDGETYGFNIFNSFQEQGYRAQSCDTPPAMGLYYVHKQGGEHHGVIDKGLYGFAAGSRFRIDPIVALDLTNRLECTLDTDTVAHEPYSETFNCSLYLPGSCADPQQ